MKKDYIDNLFNLYRSECENIVKTLRKDLIKFSANVMNRSVEWTKDQNIFIEKLGGPGEKKAQQILLGFLYE